MKRLPEKKKKITKGMPSAVLLSIAIHAALFLPAGDAVAGDTAVPSSDFTGVVYNDLNGNGIRDTGEQGVANVTVSNGKEVVASDRKGRYKLPVSDDCIIFVIKPAGWKTPLDGNNLPRFHYIHKPSGSPSHLKFPGIAATGPLPGSVDFPLQRQNEPEAFNVLLFGDPQVYKEEHIIYLRRQLAEVIGVPAAFGISLGDNVSDTLDLLDELNRAVSVIGIPWYNVAGNHDMNLDALDDAGSLDTFKSIYGPVDYAFNFGKVHFIVLDSIIAQRTKQERLRYDEGLGAKQLVFIANDLKYVEKDTLVILLMHGGLQRFSQPGRDGLFQILKDFDQTVTIAGHDHRVMSRFYDAEANFLGKNPHHYYNAGAVCGAWWSGTPDPFSGTPVSMMPDGVPSGYAILALDGSKYSIKHKSFGRPADYQMTISAPDEVESGQLPGTKVIANVFAASDKATVRMSIDGNASLPMVSFEGTDSYFEKMLQWEKAHGLRRSSWEELPRPTLLWEAALPKNLSEGLHVINIESTDVFGQTFSAKKIIKVKIDE